MTSEAMTKLLLTHLPRTSRMPAAAWGRVVAGAVADAKARPYTGASAEAALVSMSAVTTTTRSRS